MATREMEGLPTAGGVTAPPSRAGSVRDVAGVVPSSPIGTKHSINTRPATAASEEATISHATDGIGRSLGDDRTSLEANTAEKGPGSPTVEDHNPLENVPTTTSTVDKRATMVSEDDDDDDDDHIHTAVPPELLTNPGDSCAICIDTLEDDDDIRGLTCDHAFHAACLDPWLTSRRACCPLCKADYYVPKPRPEGEAADNDRSRRRRDGRMPQPPPSAWTGIRSNPRLILPGRFMTPAVYPVDSANGRSRRARPEAASAAQASSATPADGAIENSDAAAQRRSRPRISNPFSNMRMPAIHMPGRALQRSTAAGQNTPSPSQLEAGTVVR
jgi:hypothetical protein